MKILEFLGGSKQKMQEMAMQQVCENLRMAYYVNFQRLAIFRSLIRLYISPCRCFRRNGQNDVSLIHSIGDHSSDIVTGSPLSHLTRCCFSPSFILTIDLDHAKSQRADTGVVTVLERSNFVYPQILLN